MKVLIIGGTGTISSPIASALANDSSVELFILNRGKRKSEKLDGVNYLIGDIKDVEGIKEILKDYSFDVVINFLVMDENDARNNYELFKDKTKQFIFISTVVVLNSPNDCIIDENSEVGNNYSLYGRNKAKAEKYFLEKYKNDNFNVVIVRPSQTYSDSRIPLSVKGKNYWGVVSRMIRGKKVIIHGDGQSVWSATHADDFVKGFIPLVGNEKINGEIFQIMNTEIFTWDEVYMILADLLGVEYKPVYISSDILLHSKKYDLLSSIQGDKRWSKIFDISKIQCVSDFECEISLKEGLKMYLDYMDNHPEEKVEDEEFDNWCDNTIAIYEKYSALISEEIE